MILSLFFFPRSRAFDPRWSFVRALRSGERDSTHVRYEWREAARGSDCHPTTNRCRDAEDVPKWGGEAWLRGLSRDGEVGWRVGVARWDAAGRLRRVALSCAE